MRLPPAAGGGAGGDLGEDGVDLGWGEAAAGARRYEPGGPQAVGSAAGECDGGAVGTAEVAVAGRGGPRVGAVRAVGHRVGADALDRVVGLAQGRSEERRVGKEWRWRWWTGH